MNIITLGGYKIRPVVLLVQERNDKTEFILHELALRGIHPDQFNGFSGDFSGLGTKFTYELDDPGGGWNIGAKPVATWLSMYSMLSALNMLSDDYFMVMEWDARFQTDWVIRTDKALRDVPKDFDMLYIGSCCAERAHRNHIAGDVWDVKWPMCNHATIIARKCIPDILRTQRKVYAPWDISLMLHTFKVVPMKIYTVLPRIVDQFDTNLQP